MKQILAFNDSKKIAFINLILHFRNYHAVIIHSLQKLEFLQYIYNNRLGKSHKFQLNVSGILTRRLLIIIIYILTLFLKKFHTW